MEAFARAGINTNWLLTGEGPMLLSELDEAATWRASAEALQAERDALAARLAQPQPVPLNEPAEHEVPKAMEPHRTVSDILCVQGDYDAWAEAVPVKDLFVPIRYFRHARVSAGHGAQNSHEAPDALLFSKSFLRTIGARPANLFLVRVKGDSMLPTLQAGWTVMLDASRTEVSSGIYVVRLGDEELVKRLEARPGGVIKVISDNRMYDEYDIDLSTAGDDFTVLGKVIWFAGLMQ